MQVSHSHPHGKKKLFNAIHFLLKACALLLVAGFIFYKVKQDGVSIRLATDYMKLAFSENSFAIVLIALLLMPANWFCEAWKWKVIASKIENTSLIKAGKGVLTGLALGFATPHSLGDYAGRIWQMDKKNREKALGGILFSRWAQMAVTLTFGIPGLIFFVFKVSDNSTTFHAAFAVLMVLGLVVIMGIILLLPTLIRSLFTRFGKKYWFRFIEILSMFNPNEIWKIMGISVLRYLIFAGQFLLILYLFGLKLPIEIQAMGVAFIYLAKSVIPAFNFLSDLGVREFSALLFFEYFPVDTNLIISASLSVWLLNIFTPTIIGALLILKMKIFRKDS
jgi:hypothetical protein